MLGVSLFISSCNLYSNHNHIACPECGRCINAECDGEEVEKCRGHTPKHEHVACPECGKCTEAECDGEKTDKCLGHTPKHEHVACPECGLCINSECDKEGNKCLGHNKELYFIPIKERLLNFNIISDWLNSKYNEINEPYYDAYVKYENFYNILPNDYAKQKNMYLIETYTPIAFQLKSYKSLFIWNNGIIKELYKGKIKEIVHTAIIDSNKDGFDEILVSLNKNDNNSSIIIYDTKSNNYLTYDYTFKEVNENYLFFKFMDNQIAIYYNNKHDDETATTLYKNLIKNELVYKFNETEICASSIEWDIYITIDEGNVNFPIFIDGTNLYFYTKTIMLYKGELFNYNKYLENRPGAKLIFMNDQLSSFKCNKTYNSDGVYHPDIVVENGEIIVESYYYEYKNDPRVLGDYELIFGFGATKNDQIIEQCLSINKLNLEENDYTSNHEHIICLECGKCTDTECHGTDGDNCQGHASKHEHTACYECGKCTDAECDGDELDKCYKIIPLIFEPTSNNKVDLNNFVKEFLNNENFNDSYDWYYNFTNLIPEQITNKYGISVFKVNKINNLQFTLNIPTICYYIKYKDSIINIADFTNVNIEKFSNESGFIQFSITDCNHDGNIELLMSYFDDESHLTGIYIYDTLSQLIYSEFYKAQSEVDMNYKIFNYDEKNGLCVYTSKSKLCSNEIVLYKELKGNFMTFDFVDKNKIINELFYMCIKFDEKYVNFPIYIFKNGVLNFSVTVKFEYLGDPKIYYLEESEFEYLDIIFVSQSEEVLRCEKIHVDDYYDFGEFKLNNGDIIVKSFDFYINLQGYKDINKICGFNNLYIVFDNGEYLTNNGVIINIKNDGAK